MTLFFMAGFTMLIKDWGAQLLSVLVFSSECPSPRWVAFHGYEPHLPGEHLKILPDSHFGELVLPHTEKSVMYFTSRDLHF